MFGNDRPNIRFRHHRRVGRWADLRLIRPVIGQALDQVAGRRHVDGWR
jgi:hypothetical protein